MCHLRSLGRAASLKIKASKMRVQDLIFSVLHILHMLLYVHQGGSGGSRGGVSTSLTGSATCVTEPVAQMDRTWKHLKHGNNFHASQEKQQVYKTRYTWACSWIWRHHVALLQSVAIELPCGTLALKLREEKTNGWVDVCLR